MHAIAGVHVQLRRLGYELASAAPPDPYLGMSLSYRYVHPDVPTRGAHVEVHPATGTYSVRVEDTYS